MTEMTRATVETWLGGTKKPETCCNTTPLGCQSLKELGGQDDSGIRCCDNCNH